MLTLNVNGTQGAFTLNLPTTLSDITKEYITNVTSHIEVDANYTVVGTVFREKLSTLILASRRNKKNSEISVIPIFVKAGKTDSELINKLDVGEKLIIAPSDIMLGYHLSTPTNLLTINNILNYNFWSTWHNYIIFLSFSCSYNKRICIVATIIFISTMNIAIRN